MKKKPRPAPAAPRRRRLPDHQIILLDRARVPWQDHQLTWRNKTQHGEADAYVCVSAPPLFHLNAVLQPDYPYLWVGIDPDPAGTSAHVANQRICFAVIAGEALRELAEKILQYSPAARKDGAR